MTSELCFRTAVELSALIRSGELSARELLAAHLDQIERVNPRVNAIVTLTADLAQQQAAAADEAQAAGKPLGPLHGLPVAHKDLVKPRVLSPSGRQLPRLRTTAFNIVQRRMPQVQYAAVLGS